MPFLSKFLPFFVLPLGFGLILLMLGAALGRRRTIWTGVFVLLLASNPLVGHFAIRSAEGWAERRAVAQVPVVDAIVVLSAGQRVAPGSARVVEWSDANRFFAGTELFLAGKAPLLVFTGASISREPGVPSEGELLATKAVGLGVPAKQIAVTRHVFNTADEAREVFALLLTKQVPRARVLLVTSAFHMPRARQLFEQMGIAVEPYPVSFWSSGYQPITFFSFVPSVYALSETQTGLREFYGRAFYWLRAELVARKLVTP